MQANNVPFTSALVGDLAPDRAPACAQRLQACGVNATPFTGKAVDTVWEMVKQVPSNALCFAYVDPYSLEYLDLEILRAVSSLRKVDLAVHFSTMDLARNVEVEFDINGRARFDRAAPGWQERVDVTKMTKAEARLAFFQYWLELVQGLGFKSSQVMPLVPNDSGHSIYRLVFFSRHELPLRIWGDVARGPQRGFDFS
jgi:three-Cys-motif partner protein